MEAVLSPEATIFICPMNDARKSKWQLPLYLVFSYTAIVNLPPPKEEEKRLQKAIDMNETATLENYRDRLKNGSWVA